MAQPGETGRAAGRDVAVKAPERGPRRRRRALTCVCVLSWIGGAIATHVPPRRPASSGFDLGLHTGGYFILAAVLWLTLRAHGLSRGRRIGWMALATAVYAALDELTQPIFRRTASVADWIANLAGVAVALIVLETLERLRARRP